MAVPVDARPLRVLITGHFFCNVLNRRKLDYLARNGRLEVHLLIPDRWTGSMREVYDCREEREGPGYRIHPVPIVGGYRNRMQIYAFGPRIGRLLDSIAPDVVHVEEEPYSLVAFQLAWLLRRKSRILFFTSYQNIRKRYPIPFSRMETFVMRSCRGAFAGTRRSVEVLREKGLERPIFTMSYGVDLETIRRVDPGPLRQSLGLTGPVVGFLGRFVPVKGLPTLVRAFARLGGHPSLLLVGSGPLRDSLIELGEGLGMADRIVIVENVGHARIAPYLSAMDVLVLPSVTLPHSREQFGRVLIEGMACGVPTVGSSSGEIPEVVGTVGRIFPEGDVDALVTTLRSILDDPVEARRLSAAGLAHVSRHYAMDVIATRTARIYLEAAGRCRPPDEEHA